MTIINEKRENIIEEAKACLGIEFHHQGRSEFGLDCAGLIIFVLKKVGLYEEGCDIKAYSRLPNGNKIGKLMSEYFDLISIDEAKSGDILLFRFENNPQHLAWLEIDSENNKNMIHAYGITSVNKVVINRFDEKWKNKLVSVYKIRNIESFDIEQENLEEV